MEDNERKLSPMAFEKTEEQFPWGKETYVMADLGFVDSKVSGGWLRDNALSDIMETYLERVVGDNAFYYYGRQFPLMVKKIDCVTDSPLMVCPDDIIAAERYDSLGKAKFWYVTEAADGACVGIGLAKDLSAEEFYYGCEDGSVLDSVNRIPVKAGDCFYISPGIVHFIGAGVGLVEVAESSALDFMLYRQGNDAADDESGAADALDFVNLSATAHDALHAGEEGYKVLDSGEFVISGIPVSSAMKISTSDSDGFYIYICVSGEAMVAAAEGDGGAVALRKGESVLVPADCTDFVVEAVKEGTVLVEATAARKELEESYVPDGRNDNEE